MFVNNAFLEKADFETGKVITRFEQMSTSKKKLIFYISRPNKLPEAILF